MLQLPFAERHEDPGEIRRQEPSWGEGRPTPAATEARLEFGRFSVSLRKRELVADGVPVKLGTRAFDVLLVLAEANGSLVVKGELLRRAWPGIVVSEDNLKVQISELRRALGDDHDLILTEFGRGYRLTAAVRRTGPELPEALPALAATVTSAGGKPVEFGGPRRDRRKIGGDRSEIGSGARHPGDPARAPNHKIPPPQILRQPARWRKRHVALDPQPTREREFNRLASLTVSQPFARRLHAAISRENHHMRSLFARLIKDEAGVTAIEYGLIAALIAVVIIGAVTTLGTKLSTLFTTIATSL